MKEHVLPIGVVLAIVGIILTWQSNAIQSRQNTEMLSMERDILQLERDILTQVNINNAETVRSVEDMSEAITGLTDVIEELRQDIRNNARDQKQDSDRRVAELSFWMRAGCYASANGSAESRDYCAEVDKLLAGR